MTFLLIMQWIRSWYHLVMFPIITTPFYYGLVALWITIVGSATYLFVYKIDPFRMQYVFRKLSLAIVMSAGAGLLAASLVVALYQYVVNMTLFSDFFKHSGMSHEQLSLFWPTVYVSQILIQRIMTVLFLIFSTLFSFYFVSDCLYQLQDDRHFKIYAGIVLVTSVICYFICMMFGAV